MNVFDIVGPVMIGPSSSHTAGALRIGKVARTILGEQVVHAQITLYESFAATHRGHGTDRAILSGLLGMETDDERVRTAFEIAELSGLKYTFQFRDQGGVHPNSVEIVAEGKNGKTIQMTGASVGGGNILIHRINGIEVGVTGELHTLIIIHQDMPGVVASVGRILALQEINIAAMKLFRADKGGEAIMVLETDQPTDSAVSRRIRRIRGVQDAVVVEAMKVR